jgi:hypothetical protein
MRGTWIDEDPKVPPSSPFQMGPASEDWASAGPNLIHKFMSKLIVERENNLIFYI